MLPTDEEISDALKDLLPKFAGVTGIPAPPLEIVPESTLDYVTRSTSEGVVVCNLGRIKALLEEIDARRALPGISVLGPMLGWLVGRECLFIAKKQLPHTSFFKDGRELIDRFLDGIGSTGLKEGAKILKEIQRELARGKGQ